MVPLSSDLKQQLWWWSLELRVCHKRLPIPNPEQKLPAWALDAYPDAAGGSSTPGRGSGVVLGKWWSQVLWGDRINFGGKDGKGKALGSKLSVLELVGPLMLLSGAPDMVRGKPCGQHWKC